MVSTMPLLLWVYMIHLFLVFIYLFIYSWYSLVIHLRTADIEKSFFGILFILKQTWIVIFLFRQIQHQSELFLVLNLSENCNYNPNLVWINAIPKKKYLSKHVFFPGQRAIQSVISIIRLLILAFKTKIFNQNFSTCEKRKKTVSLIVIAFSGN